ncbi:uncharacterized protein METZ01_LOCUS188269, partial [marine metagenome]
PLVSGKEKDGPLRVRLLWQSFWDFSIVQISVWRVPTLTFADMNKKKRKKHGMNTWQAEFLSEWDLSFISNCRMQP